MILVDANLLLYAYDSESPHHEASGDWLEGAFRAVSIFTVEPSLR